MKGFFTQGLFVLAERAIPTDEIARKLSLDGFGPLRPTPPSSHWSMGGSGLLFALPGSDRGQVIIDVIDRIWPDHMGGKSEPELFAAWGMGHFGPFAYPGNLARAVQQAWGWDGAEDAAARHTGMIRIRSTYAVGASPNAPVIPEKYDPVQELLTLSKVALALSELPGVLAYWNPNGEMLTSGDMLAQALEAYAQEGLLPLHVWTNRRLFRDDDNHLLMDSVGMAQVDLADHEVRFPEGTYSPQEVAGFIYDLLHYTVTSGAAIGENETADGPGGRVWRAQAVKESELTPPRSVIRWVPVEGTR